MLLEDIREVLLPPAKDGPFFEALKSYRPDEVAALSLDISERQGGEAREHRTLGDKRTVFDHEESADKNRQTDNDRDACFPYRAVFFVHRVDNRHHQESAQETQDSASGRRVIDDNNLEDDKKAVSPAYILVPPLPCHEKQGDEDVDKHVNREIDGVAEGAIDARQVLRGLEHAPDL